MEHLFKINGGKKLKGEVNISGFKNAALPIIAATLVVKGNNIIKNVPKISDIDVLLNILSEMGAVINKINNHDFEINTDNVKPIINVNHWGISQMRGSILLLGPLLARFGEIKIPFPGGCVLGKRSVNAHLSAFEQLGAEIIESKTHLHLKFDKKNLHNYAILPEMSVTATENIIIFSSYFNKKIELKLAAQEPHVQNLCEFLQSSGSMIQGIGTHNLIIHGGNNKNGIIEICPDMLEAGMYILAGVLTDSEITINNVKQNDFDIFFQKLKEVNANFLIENNQVKTLKQKEKLKAINLKTSVYPGFPTDLLAPFSVLLTQCHGVSRVFETLFEGRFAYLFELEKMGAQLELYNHHQALIIGPSSLKGANVSSQDIRAGAAVLLATLVAKGESLISNVNYIFRGYEDIVSKFQALNADIEHIKI